MQANLTCRLHLIALNSIVIVCMHRVCKVESLSYLSYFTISNVIAPQFICIDEALLGYINIIHIRFPSSLHIVFFGVFLMQHKVGRKRYIKLGPGVLQDFPKYTIIFWTIAFSTELYHSFEIKRTNIQIDSK